MTQRTRILVAVLVLIVLVGAILGIEAQRRMPGRRAQGAAGEPTLAPGSIPITLDGRLAGSFSPDDLSHLEKASFVDAEESKTQEGWLLRDVILLHVDREKLQPDTTVTVSSSSRAKAAQLTWAEVDDPANLVLFDLSSRGTLKLVSLLDKLDTRDEWVQDADGIEISSR